MILPMDRLALLGVLYLADLHTVVCEGFPLGLYDEGGRGIHR